MRSTALGVHAVRAADALQLAGAVTVFQGGRGACFVSLDDPLRDAASGEV